eukprot:SAG22_NODE_402_length_11035_cov_6.315929_10_plen_339_part_00
MAAPLRRFRSIAAAVAGQGAEATLSQPPATQQLQLLEQARKLAAGGSLVPSDFPAGTIRELMVAGDGMTETERRWAAEMPSDIEIGAAPQPLCDGEGRVTAAHMGWVRALEVAAAAEGRYEDASYLSRLQRVIDPDKPRLTYEDCSPEAPEDAAQFFLDNGFVIVRGAMSPDRVARVQAAWERLAGPSREAWLEHRSHCSGIARHSHARVEDGWKNVARKWYGVTDVFRLSGGEDVPFLEADDAFIDVVDCPKVAAVAERALVGWPSGNEGVDGDKEHIVAATGDKDPWTVNRGKLRCTSASPRTYPPDADGEGYTYATPCVASPPSSDCRGLLLSAA